MIPDTTHAEPVDVTINRLELELAEKTNEVAKLRAEVQRAIEDRNRIGIEIRGEYLPKLNDQTNEVARIRSDSEILAEMWHCSDEDCNCYQPEITERQKDGILIQEIEFGPFHSDPDQDEWKEQVSWLLKKARELKVDNLTEIEERYKDHE